MHKPDDTTAYHALFQHSSLGIIVSNTEGVIEQINPFASRLFGYETDELVGKKIEVLIPKKLTHKHIEHRAHYNENPKPRSMGIGMDLWAARKDNTEFPVEISLANYEIEGRKLIVSFINDITERKKTADALKKLNSELEKKVNERTNELSQAIMELQHINGNLEQEMEQRKKAEEEVRHAFEKERELSELKSRFVSMASHEFRTPLAGILSSASLITRYDKESDAEKRNKHINTIKGAVQNLTSILNDFLSLDKLEQGKTECRPSAFLVIDFINELIEETTLQPGQENRIVHQHRGKNNEVKLDKDMLKNILINLLSNALKYSKTDKQVILTSTLDDSHLTITIEDEGIGIPQADQKHLFETFFRAKNSYTIQGTGLGLNIVKRYLDLMGGNIHFTSTENSGTTFTITLPLEVA